MMSQPLKSTITAAAVSALPARDGVLDSTCSRNSVAPKAVHAAIATWAAHQPRALADESGGRIVPERCAQQSFLPAVHSISDGPATNHEIMQDRVAQMPIQIRIDEMPGAAAHSPCTPDTNRDRELQPRNRSSSSAGRRTCSHTLQRVREAREQRNRRPDLVPSGEKNGEGQHCRYATAVRSSASMEHSSPLEEHGCRFAPSSQARTSAMPRANTGTAAASHTLAKVVAGSASRMTRKSAPAAAARTPPPASRHQTPNNRSRRSRSSLKFPTR